MLVDEPTVNVYRGHHLLSIILFICLCLPHSSSPLYTSAMFIITTANPNSAEKEEEREREREYRTEHIKQMDVHKYGQFSNDDDDGDYPRFSSRIRRDVGRPLLAIIRLIVAGTIENVQPMRKTFVWCIPQFVVGMIASQLFLTMQHTHTHVRIRCCCCCCSSSSD